MARSKAPSSKKPVSNIVLDDPDDLKGNLRAFGGSKSDKWNRMIADQVWNALWTGNADKTTIDNHLNAVAGALTGIRPANELEGMLAAQLIAAHNAAMECYRRAMLQGQTFEGRQAALSQAGKLSRTFSSLLDTFHRQRGRAPQKVVVEHVHVHAGGQAVVGVVNGPGGGASPKIEGQPHAKQIADASQPALWSTDAGRELVPLSHDDERSL